jgi:ABC-2 type transport system permease protein
MSELLHGIWIIAYRELLRFVQERSRLVSSFAMPIVFLVIFGAGFSKSMGMLAPGVNYIQFMYPGIVSMIVLMGSLMSGVSIVWDREFGFLREVLVSPLNRSGIVLGKVVGSAITSVGQGLVMTGLALLPFIGVKLTPMIVLKLIPLLIIVSVSLSGLGILLASRMRSQQGFQMMVQIIVMPLTFLSGAFFPINNVPSWLAVVSKINPMTYGVDAIRQVFLTPETLTIPSGQGLEGLVGNISSTLGITVLGHTMTILEDALIMSAIGIILLVLAVWSFNKQE